ncbi:MAG: heterodisulfide reductase-related iron-sulfur binding cluster [Elusimicrobia bacterium]|nr:heterodisulfide reductase-related iron-sulfur binding cluster [Elusimicrobiota bacterium]
MEATREIYWNVGHGVILPMYGFFAAAAGAMAYGFYKKLAVYRSGKALDRVSGPADRLARAVSWALAQLKVLRNPFPGLFHAGFFWGFLLLTAGTTLIMAQEDFTARLFGLRFLQGDFYRGFSFVLDIAGLAAIVALLVFFVRRFLYRPKGLDTAADDCLAHALLFFILVTGFVIEGARMAVTELHANPELARFSPVGLLVAGLLPGDPSALEGLHKTLWWTHMFAAFGFIAMIPFSKLRHLFLIPVNYFFSDTGPLGGLKTIDLADESAQTFGAEKVNELSWKDIYDSDACVSCKRCQDECPAYATGKTLSPMKVIQDLRGSAFAGPETDIIAAVTDKALWACTTCRSCQTTCPAAVEHVPKIIEMRRNLTLMKGEFAGEEGRAAVSSLEVNKNPFGLPNASRADWAAGLGVKPLSEDPSADILYFAGCYASFDRRNKAVAAKFMEICAKAGVKAGLLGKEEQCCGEPARKLGNEYLYQELAGENIKAFAKYGVKKIVTACPHCRHTLGVHYRDLGFEGNVVHYTVFIKELIDSGKLKLKAEPFEFTYHDSCYMSRYSGITEEPRAVLAAAGGSLAEMERHGDRNFCCGGGGGRALLEEKEGTKISVERVKMARATGRPVVVSNCPFCLTMLEDGIKTADCETALKARDLAEVVAERLA